MSAYCGKYHAFALQFNVEVVRSPLSVLIDGPHDIKRCAEVSERVFAACYKALNDHHVLLEGSLVKPNMVTTGSDAKKVAPEVVGEYMVHTLLRTVPPAVPGVVFLSGGQSEEEATLNLNAMNKLKGKKPWTLSFSFGRALQRSALNIWAGKKENVEKARAAFLSRCKANSEATLGAYKGDVATEDYPPNRSQEDQTLFSRRVNMDFSSFGPEPLNVDCAGVGCV